jgi:HSP20 family protein
MTLVKFANGKKENSLNPLFSDVFESFFNDSFTDRMVARVPAVNIAETDANYHIELAVPGMKKEDFKINLDRNILSVSSEKKEEAAQEGKKYNKREYSYTSFVRSFSLPDTVDHANIEAEYVDGILKIDVAKKEEAKFQTREISIK